MLSQSGGQNLIFVFREETTRDCSCHCTRYRDNSLLLLLLLLLPEQDIVADTVDVVVFAPL